jgi:hypothetical protein
MGEAAVLGQVYHPSTFGFAINIIPMRHAVLQMVEALHYKLESHGFNSWWCHQNFALA